MIKSSRSLHSTLVGIDRCLPSFNFKPSEDPETPIQCYYEFLACGILADAPRWLRITFPVCLSAYPVTLFVSCRNHAGVGGGVAILSISRQPRAPSLVQACRRELQSLEGPPLPQATGEQTEGRGSSTNNWSPRGCLLNSNGIMLFGRRYCAHFLIKDSLETVYFFNKSLNKHSKTLHGVNFSASVYKLQVCPGENPARPFPAPKVRADVGHGTGSLPTSRQRTRKARALGTRVFVNNRGISLSNN